MENESRVGDNSDRSLTSPDEIVHLANLYDRYGVLLKDNQRDIFEAYVLDNLSLGEIAEEYGITRQGVYDTINRARRKLRDYEEKLHLVARERKIHELIGAADMDEGVRARLLEEIDSL